MWKASLVDYLLDWNDLCYERITMINRKVTIQGAQFDLVQQMCREMVVVLVERLADATKWCADSYDTEVDRTLALDRIMGDIKDVTTLHAYMGSHENFEMVKENANG